MSIRHLIASVIIISCIWSCTDNTVATFTTPSTYKFTAPFLEDKAYYVRENNTYRKVADTLEDFLVDNDIVADSLNARLNKFRSKNALLSVEFVNSTDMILTFGRLVDSTQQYIVTHTTNYKYSLSGNKVQIEGISGFVFELDNEFRELHDCFHASDRVFNKYQSDTIASKIRNYDFRLCEFTNDSIYIMNMKNEIPGYFLDTLAIYRVTVIYSNYK